MPDPKFEKPLTQEEIQIEIDKVGDFFKRIPDELKADAAEHFIYEIVNWGSRDHYQALGIFEEAKIRYRERSIEVMDEEIEEELLKNAYENAVDYKCIQEIDFGDNEVTIGDICKIGFVEENGNYSGGKRYEVFLGDGVHFDICQNVLEEHFELIVVGEKK